MAGSARARPELAPGGTLTTAGTAPEPLRTRAVVESWERQVAPMTRRTRKGKGSSSLFFRSDLDLRVDYTIYGVSQINRNEKS